MIDNIIKNQPRSLKFLYQSKPKFEAIIMKEPISNPNINTTLLGGISLPLIQITFLFFLERETISANKPTNKGNPIRILNIRKNALAPPSKKNEEI